MTTTDLGEDAPAVAGRRPPAPAVWWLAAVAPAARVWRHGPDGRAGALLLLLLGALVVAAVVVDGLRPPARLAAGTVLVAVGWWTVVPLVGRAPWLLVVVTAPVAAVACGLRPRAGAPACWRWGPASGVALVVLASAWWWWVLDGSVLVVAVLLAVAALLVGAAALGPNQVRRLDRAVARPVAWMWAPVARAGRSVADWWRRPSTAGSRWAGAVAATVAAPVFWRLTTSEALLVHGTNDFEAHVRRAEALTLSPLFVSVPHPGWHLLFLVVRFVVGTPLAIVVIGSVATGLLVGLLASVGRSEWDDVAPMSPRVAALFGLSYLVAENVAQLVPRGPSWWQRLDLVGQRARGSSYYPLHQWGSPTITLSLPLVLLMVLMVLFAVRGDLDRARRHRVALGVATVAATMTLPAATLALVPAVPLYLLVTRRLTRERLRVLVPWFLLPGALCCLAQTGFLASGVSSFERTTWRWNPGWLVPYVGLDRPVFWFVLLVVPAGCWLVGRRLLADPAVGVTLVMLLVSLGPALLLQQTAADKAADGDLAMPALFAGILLTVAVVRLVVVELESVWRRRREVPVPPAAVTASLLLALMLVAGVVDLLSAAGVVPEL